MVFHYQIIILTEFISYYKDSCQFRKFLYCRNHEHNCVISMSYLQYLMPICMSSSTPYVWIWIGWLCSGQISSCLIFLKALWVILETFWKWFMKLHHIMEFKTFILQYHFMYVSIILNCCRKVLSWRMLR